MSKRRFLVEWFQVFVLVAATYNPTGWCYLVWVSEWKEMPASVFFVFGSLLVAGYVYVIDKAVKGLGLRQVLAFFVFLWFVLWMLTDLGLAAIRTESAFMWALILISSLTLSVAKTWPELRRTKLLKRGKKKSEKSENWLEGDW